MGVYVDNCEFISDHAVINCAIDFSSSLVNCQTRISYRGYHCINMSDFRSDLKYVPFVKCPANSVLQLYNQYVCELDHRQSVERACHKDKSQYNSKTSMSNRLV